MFNSHDREVVERGLLRFLQGFVEHSPFGFQIDQTRLQNACAQFIESSATFEGQSPFKRGAVFCVCLVQHSPIISRPFPYIISPPYQSPPETVDLDINASVGLMYTMQCLCQARLTKHGLVHRIAHEVVLSKHSFMESCLALMTIGGRGELAGPEHSLLISLVLEQAAYLTNTGLRYAEVVRVASPTASAV